MFCSFVECNDGTFLYTSLLNNLEEYNSDLMGKYVILIIE
jgi:hypothetical protein